MSAAATDLLNAWYYRQMAWFAGVLRRHDVEIEYWQRVRALRPHDTEALCAIANRLASRGRRHEAIEALEQATSIDPDKGYAWFNLGFLYQELGEHEQAMRAFDRAVEVDAKLDRAWYGKALSLIKLGRVEDAIAPLKKNIELQPLSPYGYYQLVHVYHRLGRVDPIVATIRKLSKFEPKVALQLERETGVDAGIEDPYDPGRRSRPRTATPDS